MWKVTLLHYWWECKLVQPLWRTVWRVLKKSKIESPYDPAIPLLGIYLDKTVIQKIHAPQYSQQHSSQQPRCGSNLMCIYRWMEKKMWYINTVEYHSAIKGMKIISLVATWMDLEMVTLTRVRKRMTNTVWCHFDVESKIRHKRKKQK